MRFTKVGLTRTGIVAGAFIALEVLCRTGIIPRATMIPPTEMAAALWQILRSGQANNDIAFTLINTVAAIALSVFLGFWLGAALHALPRLRRVFEPLLSAYYAVPVFIFYPLLIVAFGVGRTALIVMGAMFGVVAMIVNTCNGPRSRAFRCLANRRRSCGSVHCAGSCSSGFRRRRRTSSPASSLRSPTR